ncbi:hypothetical protein MUCCIDRAFT_155678 [Mucor lusitanicus CBS 277.49]|uniref:Uncharacterized protein n=1 Tax=Mucor lusitanicus CBS 277.49 TaxID=747725 RepID=A0A168MAY1_MUCCL|nr:hypothetical protein MUCCIDRAFT_155678 [Mucor lusitanicus CBS 277.49]
MRTLKPPNYSYWSSTPVEEWEITNYDLNLCKQGPITKQAAHAHLLSDIKLLLNALPNNIRKQANVLSTQFKNRKTNTVNVKFWKTTATKLSKAHLDKAAVDTELENAAKETAVTVLTRLNKRKCKGKGVK